MSDHQITSTEHLRAADPRAVVQGPGYRITVLTSRMLRLEHSADGAFEDRPTQLVRDRAFDVPEFGVRETETGLELWTEHLHLRYDRGPFTPSGLAVSMRQKAQGAHFTTWTYGDPVWGTGAQPSNLGGTARTLDDVDGATPIETGLLSTDGYTVVDDSTSLALDATGWPVPRQGGDDLYFFGYGRDFTDALADWFRLTGPSPMLPRWTLGNWWSRFHDYTTDSYLALMDRFADEGIPFSVAVIDMDWHVTDIDPAIGSGWTGYTWNTELFPDPEAFLRGLHDRHLRTALNVHPADGVRRHEDAYVAMATELGLDPEAGAAIGFDIGSRAFADAYLRHLHHPHEEIGVDFWWLDWQSGSASRTAGLDPLWALNELHYADSGRDGERPLTFSRYAGLGSHRTPVGFSGDTVATWDSLAFQPRFTSTAANVGYFWWSHDIGGHFGGARDDELSARWYQFGAFSPVNRLHSSKSPFGSKEPWRFTEPVRRVMTEFLRLRHRLVPYLYTAMWDSHTHGVGPVRPMYHDHPREQRAFEVPDQYMFGPDLLVAPVVVPVDPQTRLAAVPVWLPEGEWVDLFTGRRYDGGRDLVVHRSLEQMPVFARAGSLLVLADDPTADTGARADSVLVRVFPGADGSTRLLEDDGQARPGLADQQVTVLRQTAMSDETTGTTSVVVSVDAPTGPGVLLHRTVRVELVGVADVASAVVRTAAGEASVGVEPGETGVVIDLGTVDLSDGLTLTLHDVRQAPRDLEAAFFTIVDDALVAYDLKRAVMDAQSALDGAALIAALHRLDLPGNLFGALVEQVAATTGDGSDRRRVNP